MTRRSTILVLLALLAAPLAAAPGSLGYDPAADPAEGLGIAVTRAQTEGKRILVVVGGEWCSWCHILDRFVKGNDTIHDLWDGTYVTLKVHWDPEQPNEAFLGQYPGIEGYPHIFVLESDGGLLHSQNTGELEEGDGYSTDRVAAFLERWAPPPTGDAPR